MIYGVKEYTEKRKFLNIEKMSEVEKSLYKSLAKLKSPAFDCFLHFSDDIYDTIDVLVKNTKLEIGTEIKVERWDGNGNPVFVKIIDIKGDFIQFDKGYCKYGNDIIWEEKSKKGDRYWQNSHNNIDWDKYYIEIDEV